MRGDRSAASPEVVDYFLIKELYHCTPDELDRQSHFTTSMHAEFMAAEAKENLLRQKRAEQRAKQNTPDSVK